MRIAIFGLGYVGAVSCGCLAELGHTIVGVDVSKEKVDLVNRGEAPVIEEGLPERLAAAVKAGRLRATTDAVDAIRNTDVALLCVGTPSTKSGGVTTTYLENATKQIGLALRGETRPFVVMCRSTSLPFVHRLIMKTLEESSGRKLETDGIGYVCHPEFLRESVAVRDFYEPPKIVFGATGPVAEKACRELYPGIEAPTFFVSPDVAAMVKYADNCFHAVKVTFANEIGLMCHQLGVDSHDVMDIFCADTKLNISKRYLKPGAAFGGSCLPKDLRGILDAARDQATPLPMLQATLISNEHQIAELVRRIVSPQRPKVGLVGLAFKEGTDDVRESPMVSVVERLCGKGHPVKIYDKHLAVQKLVGANQNFALQSIPHLAELLVNDLPKLVEQSDVVLVSHRLKPEQWAACRFKPGQRVIDLVNIPELKRVPGYEGLYW